MRADYAPNIEVYQVDGGVDYARLYHTFHLGLYVRGADRTGTFRIYNARNKSAGAGVSPLTNIFMGVDCFSDNWESGSEILSQGMFYARKNGDPSYVALSDTPNLSLGSLPVDGYVDVDFKLTIPDPYPLDESSQTRHGIIAFKIIFSGGFAQDDPVQKSIYNRTSYNMVGFDHDTHQRRSQSMEEIDWLAVLVFVVTASEGSGLSQIGVA